jgi:tetratricopeptide (TPR) repeat protein
MTLSRTEQSDPATLAAAEGQAALGRGDTGLARTKFVEAGEVLLRDLADTYKHADKILLRFLAASQFYKAGEYQRALEQTKKIEARLLPANTRSLLPQFVRDVESRASPDYVVRMRQTFSRLWAAKENRQLLDLLKDHPYVYEPVGLGVLRAVLCEGLGHWRAAAFFYARALPLLPLEHPFVMLPAGWPLDLARQGRINEAWEYILHLLELAPNTVTNMAASILCCVRACQVTGAERRALHQEQLHFFDEAWTAFQAHPGTVQRNPELQLVMLGCLDVACLGCVRLGDSARAKRVAGDAILFAPMAPGPYCARGMLTYPDEQSLDDFRKAAGLPGVSSAPFYFLAHNALQREQFGEAIGYCQAGLVRQPGRRMKARLHGWIAVCRACQDADRNEVERLFQTALEVDPDSEQVATNYRIFQETSTLTQAAHASHWNTQVVAELIVPDIVERALADTHGIDGRAAIRDMLLAG